ncbi:MAG: hypothetical protein P8Q97_19060 [Myxococcota bacterium]|nr:hypothetical protein [Myxococcota bacterium]
MKTEPAGARLGRAAGLSLSILLLLGGLAHAEDPEVDAGKAVLSLNAKEWVAEIHQDFVVDLPNTSGVVGKVELEHAVALIPGHSEGIWELAVH